MCPHWIAVGRNVLTPDEGSITYEGATDFDKALLEAQSEASLDGILVASAEGRMLSFNSRFAEMWGIPPDLLDRKDTEGARRHVIAQLLDPGDFRERVEHVYDNPTESSQDELRLKDGRIFERYSRPILRPDTGTFGRVWFFRDATKARRASARLHAQYEVTKVMAESTDLEVGAHAVLRGHWDEPWMGTRRTLVDRRRPETLLRRAVALAGARCR